jgi:hypothetical protein
LYMASPSVSGLLLTLNTEFIPLQLTIQGSHLNLPCKLTFCMVKSNKNLMLNAIQLCSALISFQACTVHQL